jgi:hypothetical protein
VVANLSKALVLAVQVASPAWFYYSFLQYRCNAVPAFRLLGWPATGWEPCQWDAYVLQERWGKTVSATYVMTDALALLLVPKLPTSTVVHHVATTLFILGVFAVRLADYRVAAMLMFYGFWSTLSFSVNAFLALRVVYPASAWLKPVALVSALVYAVCCFFNWSFHLLWAVDGLWLSQSWR